MFTKFVIVAALLATVTQGGFIDKRQNSSVYALFYFFILVVGADGSPI